MVGLNDPPLQLVPAKILTAIQIIFDEERNHSQVY